MYEQKREANRLFSMFLIAGIFLLSLSVSSRAAEIKAPKEKLPPLFWNREYFPGRIRISPLLGDTVRNYRGEGLAKIDDLLISPEDKVEYAILSKGWLFEGRLLAMLFKQLEISYWGIYLNVTEEQLKYLPEFHYRE